MTASFSPKVYDTHTFRNVEISATEGSWHYNPSSQVYAILQGTMSNVKEVETLLGAQHPTPAALVEATFSAFSTNFIHHLKGKYTALLLDEKAQRLILFRDRIGLCPLFWYQGDTGLLFASDCRCLLRSGLIPQTPELESLFQYLVLGYVPRDRTLFRNVHQLNPGAFLSTDLKGHLRVANYWSWKHLQNAHQEQVILEELPQRLACSQQTGLSNRALVRERDAATDLLCQLVPQGDSLLAITPSFSPPGPELYQEKAVETSFPHLSHSTCMVTPELFIEQFVKLVWHMGTPIADPYPFVLWEAARHAREAGCEHLLTSLGARELFGTASRYQRRLAPPSVLMAQAIQFLFPLLRLFNEKAAWNILRRKGLPTRLLGYVIADAIFWGQPLKKLAPPASHWCFLEVLLRDLPLPSPDFSRYGALGFFDLQTRVINGQASPFFAIANAFSLTPHAPYLDEDLLRWGVQATSQSKEPLLFSKSLAPTLEEVFPKGPPSPIVGMPWMIPETWHQHPDIAKICQGLTQGGLVEAGFLSSKRVIKEISLFRAGKGSVRRLCAILSLEVWYHLFIDQVPSASPPDLTLKDLFT